MLHIDILCRREEFDAAVIYLAVQCPYQGCASAQPALLDKARSLLDQVRVEPMSMRKG